MVPISEREGEREREVVSRPRLELGAHALKGRCSTN